MVFNAKYELVTLSVDPGVMRFGGREIATGKPVNVHLMPLVPRSTDQSSDIVERLSRPGPDASRCGVIETGSYDGAPYVVTEQYAESLRQRLDSGNETASTTGPLPGGPNDATDERGDFTRYFNLPSGKKAGGQPAPRTIQPPAVEERETAPQPEARVVEARQVEPEAPPAVKPRTAPPSDAARRSDFDRAFRPNREPQTPEEPKDKPKPLAVVDRWRGLEPPPDDVPTAPLPKRTSGFSGQGEYTRMIARRQTPTPSQGSTTATSTSPPERSRILPIIVIVCLAAAAILVVVYFAGAASQQG